MSEPSIETCRPSGNPEKQRSGIGMPANLYLQQFGQLLLDAFGAVAYHVGSSLTAAIWRDVDVRLMLDDEEYRRQGFGDPAAPHGNAKWRAFSMAFSELGRRMTGLPIDFQIQDTTVANEQNNGRRSALFVVTEKPNQKP